MININKLKFSLEQINNGKNIVMITGVKAFKDYKDGKPVGDICGYSYEAVLPYNQYEKITIKIKNTKQFITEEMLEVNNSAIKVIPINFVGGFFKSPTGDYIFYSKAESLEVAK